MVTVVDFKRNQCRSAFCWCDMGKVAAERMYRHSPRPPAELVRRIREETATMTDDVFPAGFSLDVWNRWVNNPHLARTLFFLKVVAQMEGKKLSDIIRGRIVTDGHRQYCIIDWSRVPRKMMTASHEEYKKWKTENGGAETMEDQVAFVEEIVGFLPDLCRETLLKRWRENP